MWQINETPIFKRQVEQEDISKEVIDGIYRTFENIKLERTLNNVLIYRNKERVFEIWQARIPDPDHNKGKSGGFRLIYYVIYTEQALHLGLIERRGALGFKDERPKDKQKYAEYLESLKNHLNKLYENSDPN